MNRACHSYCATEMENISCKVSSSELISSLKKSIFHILRYQFCTCYCFIYKKGKKDIAKFTLTHCSSWHFWVTTDYPSFSDYRSLQSPVHPLMREAFLPAFLCFSWLEFWQQCLCPCLGYNMYISTLLVCVCVCMFVCACLYVHAFMCCSVCARGWVCRDQRKISCISLTFCLI